jgi:O-antigen ligase
VRAAPAREAPGAGSVDVSASRSIWPAVRLPSRLFEYWYFAVIFYGMLGPVLGLSFEFVAAAMLTLLAVCCVLRMGSPAILLPVALPLAFGASYVLIQILAFGEPIMGDDVRSVEAWMLSVVIIQCLALRRGFLHRFAMVIFLIGLCTLPYLTLIHHGNATRLVLNTEISIANPNDSGAWFGFCCLYFVVMCLETRRMSVRLVSALAATGCLFIAALTVSRAPLFAVAVGVLVALRRVLKRGFFPFLSLVVVAWIAYGLGLFDRVVSEYASRGLEETGRLVVWPRAIGRFLDSPLMGVGASHIATWIPQAQMYFTPHNQFIYIALASGVLPMLLFIAYFVQSGVEALRLNAHSHEDAVFLVPLFVYALLIGMELTGVFLKPWALATFGTVGATGFLLKGRQAVADRMSVRQGARRRNPAVVSARTRA